MRALSFKQVLNLEKEVKKKAVTYGVAAVLLAVLLTTIVYNLGVQPFIQQPSGSQLKTFSSYEELQNFLKINMEQAKSFQEQYVSPLLRGGEFETLGLENKAAPAHSTTNIQVAGVDEADNVKTDGEYIYVVSGGNISIVRAYPPDQARVLSKIALNETYGAEIYVNGDRLAVLGKHYDFYKYAFVERMPYGYSTYPGEAFINVYDISDRASPALMRTIILNGTLSGSRMIDDYVYAAVNQPALRPGSNETDLDIVLPTIVVDDAVKEVQPAEIRYINVSDVYYYFTTIIAVDIKNDAQKPTQETFLTGSTANMYVSESNMYLTVPNTNVWIMPLETREIKEETLIYRVKLDREKILFEAQGPVSGYVLNQFSMDEYKGYFRITTTRGWGDASVNSLYVLNMNLNIVGKLEGLAPTERIYSARFMSDRCYLVTFKQVDPFFVIDLGNPTEPKVLGFLKIPGFSGYLHPYDDNHIIGIGKQDSKVKLSLFDVTNVTAPTEAIPSYVVEGGWSDSMVLTDHKAFLFDKSKQLLALPVSINWYNVIGDTYYPKGFWQGEYVFDVSLSSSFVLRGNVTHQGNNPEPWDTNYWVKRALYIDNVLYTISDKKVKMNSLEDLGLLNEIQLD